MSRPLKINPQFQHLIPPLSPEEYATLEANILKHGCQDAIKTWHHQIVDGHNRHAICTKHHLPYQTEELKFQSVDEAVVWIIVNQFGRRNISPFTRTELALKLEPLIAEQAKRNQRKAGGAVPQKSSQAVETRKELAKLAGVSHDTVSKIKFLLGNADEATLGKLRAGKTTVNREFTAIQHQAITAKLARTAKTAPKTVAGRFDVLIIDPPWPVEKIEREARPNQTAYDYPTMTLDEIRRFKLPAQKANPNCHLFCWTTQKYLPATFDIVAGWGFKYVCTLVWHKPGGFQPFNLPQYNGEFCIYARKGTPIFTDTKAFNAVNSWRRGDHSEKPNEFYELVRRVTGGRRLDIFSRRKINGFIGWGNEAT